MERERCRLTDPVQPPGLNDPVSVGDTLDSVLKDLRLDEKDWQTEMLESWVELAGRTVAKHARPGKVSGTMLTVFVDSPVWLAEFTRTSRGPLLQALQRRFGANRITGLRFAPDPDGLPARTPPTSGA